MAKITSFEGEKLAHEIRQYDDIHDWIDDKLAENEQFWGTDLDEEKNERAVKMRKLAVALCEYDRKIKYINFPFDNTRQNATVALDFPSVYFIPSRKAAVIMANLYALADAFSVAYAENGKIRMSVSVHNMWKTKGKRGDKK